MARKKGVATKKKIVRSIAKLTTLDDFLGREGKRDEFEAIAVKEVLAWRIEQAMKKNISATTWPSACSTLRTAMSRGHAAARRAHGRAAAPARTGLRTAH
jgi:antitoxin HicB